VQMWFSRTDRVLKLGSRKVGQDCDFVESLGLSSRGG